MLLGYVDRRRNVEEDRTELVIGQGQAGACHSLLLAAVAGILDSTFQSSQYGSRCRVRSGSRL